MAAFVALIFGAEQVRGDFIPVPIGPTNANLRVYTNGTFYPVAPTSLTVGGVPFNLVPSGTTPNSLGIIQAPGGNSLFTIPTSVFNPTTVYTLINSAFGTSGAVNGRIEFVGTGGAFASFNLTQGDNLRDHFNGGFNNVVTDPTIVTATFGGGVRLDRQTFVLPGTFAGNTLTQIRFVGTGAGNPQGQAFLAAATVQAPTVVPEPSSLALVAGGLVTATALRRRGRPVVK
jgi:hypothetical protein